MRPRKTTKVTLGLTGLAAATLSGCGASDNPDAVAICTDPQTHERVADKYCHGSGHDDDDGISASPFLWYYLGTQSGTRVPAVGQPYYGGTYNAHRYTSGGHTVQRGGIPSKGVTSVKSFTKSSGLGSSHSSSGGGRGISS